MQKEAIKLWKILDDIDTASDMFKPHDEKSFKAYYNYVTGKHKERFQVFTSDGYDLFLTTDEGVGEKIT